MVGGTRSRPGGHDVLTRRLPSRLTIAALLVALLSLVPQTAAQAQTLQPDLEARLVTLTNQARAQHGLRPLAVELQLTRVARDWSNTMATERKLYHRPSLRDAIIGDWQRIGENVGVGPTIERVQEAFMASPGHRGNILGDYDRVGIGIYAQDSGRVWITVNFLRGRGDFPVFADVRANTHRSNIEGLFRRGTTLGCTFDRYCPTTGVTRGQMATFLARELGLPARSANFRDVPSSHPHAGAIGALAAAGITTGCGGSSFCPEERINRAQMAAFLARALKLPESAPVGVRDVSTSTHAGAIGALQKAGITQGCTTTSYCPTDGVTRAQMATFLQRSFD
jgi:uncharacterized protein YkwD